MGLPQLNTCCCGCTLKTGTLIILWLNVVAFIILILGFAVEQKATSSDKVLLGDNSNVQPESEVSSSPNIFGIIISVVGIVISGLGIYGVDKESHSKLVPFLVWGWIDAIVRSVISLLTEPFAAIYLVAHLVGFAIFFYLWLVVYSYYRALKTPSVCP